MLREAFGVIDKLLKAAVSSTAHFVVDLIRVIWRELIIAIVWRKIMVPCGTIGLQFLYITIKGMWYGPFGTYEMCPDGFLGPPDAKICRQNPFKHWIPSVTVCDTVGAVSGIGIGLRNYIEIVSMILRGLWYGCFPCEFTNEDGIFGQIENKEVYKTFAGRCCGIFGAVVGVRAALNLTFLIPKYMWMGSSPNFFHLRDGILPRLEAFPSSASKEDPDAGRTDTYYKSNASGYAGAIFGLVVGLRCIVNLLGAVLRSAWYGPAPHLFHLADSVTFRKPDDGQPADRTIYSTMYGPAFGIVGLLIGLRPLFSFTTLAIFGIYYGLLSEFVTIPMGCLGKPNFKITSNSTRVIFGIFGLVVGVRTILDTLLASVRGIYIGSTLLFKGAYYGIEPGRTHCTDGLLAPIDTEDVYVTRSERIVCRIASVLGLIVGIRSILNAITIIPPAVFYGAAGRHFMLFGMMGTPVWPPVTTCGRSIGFVFGAIFGVRNYIDLIVTVAVYVYTCLVLGAIGICHIGGLSIDFVYYRILLNVRHITLLVCEGAWYGLAPQRLHLIDGILSNPGDVVFSSNEEKVLSRIGSPLGAFIGLRSVVNFVTFICRTTYYGSSPNFFHCKDGMFVELVDDDVYQARFSPYFGLTGAFVGIRSILNFITAIPWAIWYGCIPNYISTPDDGIFFGEGEMKSTSGKLLGATVGGIIGVRLCLNTLAIALSGIWYGAFPSELHLQDSWFTTPVPPVWHSLYGNVIGGITGCIFGLRLVFSIVTIGIKGIWYGGVATAFFQDGLLGEPSSASISVCGRLIGTLTGGAFGLRNYLDVIFVGLRGYWYGVHGRMYTPDKSQLQTSKMLSVAALSSAIKASRGLDELVMRSSAAKVDDPPRYPEDGHQDAKSQITKCSQVDISEKKQAVDVHSAVADGMETKVGMFLGCLVGAVIWGLICYRIAYEQTTSRPWIFTSIGIGTIGGIGIAYIGQRNFLVPRFYNQTVRSFLQRTIWDPVLVPTLEAITVFSGLLIYLPFLCLVMFARKYPLSLYYLVTPMKRPGCQYFKACVRVAIPPVVYIAIYYLTLTRTPLCILIAASSGLFANLMVNFLVKLLPSPRYDLRTTSPTILSGSQGMLTLDEIHEINNVFRYKIYMAKVGKGANDPIGILRFWIRDLGLRSPDELKLKKMHDLYREGKIVVKIRTNPQGWQDHSNTNTENRPLGRLDSNSPFRKSLVDLLKRQTAPPLPSAHDQTQFFEYVSDEGSQTEIRSAAALHTDKDGSSPGAIAKAIEDEPRQTIAELDKATAARKGLNAERMEASGFNYEIAFVGQARNLVSVTKVAVFAAAADSDAPKNKGTDQKKPEIAFMRTMMDLDAEEKAIETVVPPVPPLPLQFRAP